MAPWQTPITVSATAFSVVFAAFVLAALAWRTWLALRQARHVAGHRDVVPADFAAFIPLEAHRKAADYTLEKLRLGLAETLVVDGAVLFALTLGGGVALIDALSQRLLGDGYLRNLGTVFGVLLATAAAALPFDAWRTFVIEERHGFNRTTPKLFAIDLAKAVALSIAHGPPRLPACSRRVQAPG